MTRPTILDMDLVVVPEKADVGMIGAWYRYKNGHRFAGEEPARDTSDVGAYSAMLAASPYPTAWDDVRKYVDGLEESVAFTMTDTSRMLRKSDIKDVCPHPDDCFYEMERARCGPCAVKASKLAGIEIDDTHSHLPEVCRLRREVKAAEARIAELEKRLADAERVIEPFSNMAGELFARNKNDGDVILAFDNPDDPHRVTFRDFRAARAYMEGK